MILTWVGRGVRYSGRRYWFALEVSILRSQMTPDLPHQFFSQINTNTLPSNQKTQLLTRIIQWKTFCTSTSYIPWGWKWSLTTHRAIRRAPWHSHEITFNIISCNSVLNLFRTISKCTLIHWHWKHTIRYKSNTKSTRRTPDRNWWSCSWRAYRSSYPWRWYPHHRPPWDCPTTNVIATTSPPCSFLDFLPRWRPRHGVDRVPAVVVGSRPADTFAGRNRPGQRCVNLCKAPPPTHNPFASNTRAHRQSKPRTPFSSSCYSSLTFYCWEIPLPDLSVCFFWDEQLKGGNCRCHLPLFSGERRVVDSAGPFKKKEEITFKLFLWKKSLLTKSYPVSRKWIEGPDSITA